MSVSQGRPTRASQDRPAPTPRGQRAEQALTEAVLELLDEQGFSGITVDKIASRAKVGKPTIYRRWSNKEELIAHVLGHLDPPEPIQPTDELRPALVEVLANLERRFTGIRAGRIWQRLVGEADRYPDVAALYEQQFLAPRRREIADLLRHHIQAGDLRADLDSDAAVDILVGSMLGILLTTGRSGKIPSPQVIVDLLIDGMASAPPSKRPGRTR